MKQEASHKPIIVVLGMHRSGTSLTTRALKVLGVELGDRLIPPIDGDNDKGFWEDIDINDFDNALLEKVGSSWDRLTLLDENAQTHRLAAQRKAAVSMLKNKMKSAELFGFKDPRTAILLPFWQTVFQELDLDDSYVIAVRNPLSVANSLLKRNDMPLEAGILLWAKHMSGILRRTQGKRRVVVDYDLILESPSLQVTRMASALSLPFDESSQKRLDLFENEFINRNLRHHKASLTKLMDSELVPGFVKDAYDWMLKLAKDEIDFSDTELEEFWQQFEKVCGAFNAGYQYIDRLTLSLQQHDAENKRLSDKLLEEERNYREVEVVRDQISEELAQVTIHCENAIAERDDRQKFYEELHNIYKQAITEKDLILNRLDESKKLHEEYKTLYQHAITERDDRQKSYEELHKAFKQVVTERDEVQVTSQKYIRENTIINNQLTEMLNSRSWRLTSGFRAIRHYLITLPARVLRRKISKMLRTIWAILPAGPEVKSRFKKHLFTRLPSLFRHTLAYQNWQVLEAISSNIEQYSSLLSEGGQQGLSSDGKDLYVSLSNAGVLEKLPVRLVAFYLPQFHAIPENDKWWGEGFTEWTNVKPAKPQFEGHYQPHVPGELGYYDLTDPSVQKRQIELAKQFGVGGFCFYFYWFAGKRLLETPILNYLNDSSLDLPFCLCWANENWSRTWDGLDNDVLIEQRHSPEDDFAFIEYVSRYLRDPRNMQINGQPLLLVYRPSLLPSPLETAQRWRTWCRENGIGEIYLAYTQSFEVEDPAKYGFDAAVEFPPNNSGPPVITEQVKRLSSEFTGIVYDWRIFVERSKNYLKPDYTLFRSVTPSWDNTARRKSAGAIFANSSPADYQAWLTRAIEDTLAHRENQDERLVFINAWNEWAEGAYLEPDEKYGYAYLQATRNSLESVIDENEKRRRIVLVAHDAHPHGAQYLILHMAKFLKETMHFNVDMIVLGEGLLLKDYAKYATVHMMAGIDPQGKQGKMLAGKLASQGICSAIANTTVTGRIIPTLKEFGFHVVTLVHELPGVIAQYKLQEHTKAIAEYSDYVVFPADQVKQGFETFAKIPDAKSVIKPQGLFRKNTFNDSKKIQSAREQLRHKFGLPEQSKIVLTIGYADRRKGVDLMVDIGLKLLNTDTNVYFIWVGHFDASLETKIKNTIANSPFSAHFIFPGLDFESDVYYAGADVYALTSREDPFPCVVLEALDVSLPIVAFQGAGGFTELLSRGGGKLVTAYSTAEYAAALSELLGARDRALELGMSGKQIVDDELSFRRYMFNLLTMSRAPIKTVSVIVPNYNYARYIEQRLTSITGQDYPVYEIIILDDASTDNSIDTINELLPTIEIDCKLVKNNSNTGNPFMQWLKGVGLATGDYVWIAEADDLSEKSFLSEVMSMFDSDRIVMGYSQSKQITSDGSIIAKNYLDYVSDISSDKWTQNHTEKGLAEIKDSLAIKNVIPNVSAVVFKRNTLHEVLKNNIDRVKKYRVAGDWVTYIKVLECGDIAFSSKSLNLHRRHDSSVTLSSFNKSQLQEIMSVQYMVNTEFDVNLEISLKASDYAQQLYKQFSLDTPEAPDISRDPELSKLMSNNQ